MLEWHAIFSPYHESNGFILMYENNKSPMYPFEAKQVTDTWASRIVSRQNLWLEATRKEDDGEFYAAILLYMRDALACVESNRMIRAALSCSCAAHALEKIGHVDMSRIVYSESAEIYTESAMESLDTSIRESIWCLQHAYENYVLANNQEAADDAFYLFTSLATKLSPSFGKDESLELLKYRALVYKKPSQSIVVQPHESFDDMLRSIRSFLESRRSDARLAQLDAAIARESMIDAESTPN